MRILLSLAAMTAAVCTAGVANATTFTGTFDVSSYQDGSNGLIVDASPSHGAVSFDLTAPGSTMIDLFDISTPEGALNVDDLNGQPISVTFTFDQPTDFSGSVGGTTDTGFTLFGLVDQGVVHWNNPASLTFGNGGVLNISLNDAAFGQHFIGGFSHESADISATFSLISDSAVPEPASWALMIGGFGLAGASLRRRRNVAVAA